MRDRKDSRKHRDSKGGSKNKLLIPMLGFAVLAGVLAFFLLTADVAEPASQPVENTPHVDVVTPPQDLPASDEQTATDFRAVVVPSTGAARDGSPFEARILLAKSPAGADVKVDFYNRRFGEYVTIVNGVPQVSIPFQNAGTFNFSGTLIYDGKKLPFATEYSAMEPSLKIELPNETSVLYKGIDHVVNIIAPGYDNARIEPSVSRGSVRRDGEQYTMRVNSGTECVLEVRHKQMDGEYVELGSKTFEVRSIPDPLPYFAGKGYADDKVKKNSLTAAQGVAARMSDFEHDVKFAVKGFTLHIFFDDGHLSFKSENNRTTSSMKAALKKVKRGDVVVVSSIKAKGPTGVLRDLGSLCFTVE